MYKGEIAPKNLNMITNMYLKCKFGSVEFIEQLLFMCSKEAMSEEVNLHTIFQLIINLHPENFKIVPWHLKKSLFDNIQLLIP